jgi:hypothetical protein
MIDARDLKHMADVITLSVSRQPVSATQRPYAYAGCAHVKLNASLDAT